MRFILERNFEKINNFLGFLDHFSKFEKLRTMQLVDSFKPTQVFSRCNERFEIFRFIPKITYVYLKYYFFGCFFFEVLGYFF